MAAGAGKGSHAVGKVAYMALVGKAKAVQVRNANIGALIFHLHVCSHFRAQLFIHCARVLGFRKLGQRKMSFLWKRPIVPR
jgi:hypothetical protein